MQKILITGSAGFIGFHLSKFLCNRGYEVVGLDDINDYYDVSLKYSRLEEAGIKKSKIEYGKPVRSETQNYTFFKLSLVDKEAIFNLIKGEKPDYVVNLAAQAGVRYSLQNPFAYIDNNISAFVNLLEAIKKHGTNLKHFVFASSSSVYGLNRKYPLSVRDNVDHPVSLYAATKKSNELIAHTYSYLYNIPTTGLRFFTVYGPWGRPDMALFLFTKKILADEPIDVYNHGKMVRDFTYIDDIVQGIEKVLFKPAVPNNEWNGEKPDPSTSIAPYKILNIGNSNPVNLLYFIEVLEKTLGKKAKKNFMPLQPGDVEKTYADVSVLEQEYGYKPSTSVEEGIKKFVNWYKNYYKIK
jgi:UDP-glucuronate 4-epimerase